MLRMSHPNFLGWRILVARGSSRKYYLRFSTNTNKRFPVCPIKPRGRMPLEAQIRCLGEDFSNNTSADGTTAFTDGEA